MKKNVCSTVERVVRVVIGIALLSLLFFLDGPERHLGWLGLIPIATAIFRYCPISDLFGVNTCTMQHRPHT